MVFAVPNSELVCCGAAGVVVEPKRLVGEGVVAAPKRFPGLFVLFDVPNANGLLAACVDAGTPSVNGLLF